MPHYEPTGRAAAPEPPYEPLIETSWLMGVTGVAAGGAWDPIAYDTYASLEAISAGELGPQLRELWHRQVSASNLTMQLTIRLPYDVFSGRGDAFLHHFRSAMSAAASDPTCNCSRALDVGAMRLAGGGSAFLDAMGATYGLVPVVIPATLAAVFARSARLSPAAP